MKKEKEALLSNFETLKEQQRKINLAKKILLEESEVKKKFIIKNYYLYFYFNIAC